VIIADTSGLLALYNRSEPAHEPVVEVVRVRSLPLVVSPFVVAELDYLLATRVGADIVIAVLRELSGGAYVIPEIGSRDLAAATDIVERYRDQDIGVTDASLVVLAERYGTKTILTLDRRHFQVVRPLSGGRFDLLP
jgi:hypothetical protein